MSRLLTKVKQAHGVSEYLLPNGLRVLYKHQPAAPVVAVCVTFHVGSRNEAKGHTGSTHILEHLLFKDTTHFNALNGKSPSNYLEWFGAQWNATTWLDRTNYFELMPQEHLEEALAIEADKMRNAAFSVEDLKTEMVVVRNEYERGRNNPFELLDEAVMEAAYEKHPYRIPTIGSKEDIENATTTTLRDFYNTFYWPNNATLTVVGDVSFKKVAALVEKYFAPIPRSPHTIPQMKVVESQQRRARSVTLKKDMGLSIVEVAYKITEGTHTDYSALLLLSTILGGGFSSRLQKILVDTGLAADLSVYSFAFFDPGMLTVIAHVADGIDPKKVLKLIQEEVNALSTVKGAATKDEISRARERILSEMAMNRDGALSEARALSESIAAGDWELGYTIEERISKITPAHLLTVAKKYLHAAGETSGILHP